MRKIAKANVPGIRQQTQYTCMAASVAACCMAFGKNVDENIVNKVLGASAMRGARWEEALATFQYFGLRGHLIVPATLPMIKSFTDAGLPVMIAWNPEGRPWSHASVVYDVTDTEVYVMDPNCPDPMETTRVCTHAEFHGKWYEKFSDSLLIRRPCLVVTQEVSVTGEPLPHLETGDAVFGEGPRLVTAGNKDRQRSRDMKKNLAPGQMSKYEKSDQEKINDRARWLEMKKSPQPSGYGRHKSDKDYNRNPKHTNWSEE